MAPRLNRLGAGKPKSVRLCESMAVMTSTTRARCALIGHGLVGVSAFVAVGLWRWTCGLGGFHCFYGIAGRPMAGAQFGMLAGFFLSLCGRGGARPVFSGIALLELVSCYFSLLTH